MVSHREEQKSTLFEKVAQGKEAFFFFFFFFFFFAGIFLGFFWRIGLDKIAKNGMSLLLYVVVVC